MGRVPAYSVVVPGTLPGKKLADGTPGPNLACAVIVKRVDAQTRARPPLTSCCALMDGVVLAQELLRCRSVTPADGGAQAVLAVALERLGFSVTKLRFGEIENLFAERAGVGKHLCFAGHTDVVPPGPGWGHDPFGGAVQNGMLYGRGAVDMKSGIAAFVAAAAEASRCASSAADHRR